MITANLAKISARIAAAAQKYSRDPTTIKLLAVSKTRSVAEIEQLVAAGQSCFGENYLQEALPKIQALQHHNLEWHFIGPIQTNKTRGIAENFAWVHSVERLKIARRLSEQRPTELPPLNICIEVNASAEASKAGVTFSELSELAAAISQLPNINLRGLMAIPAPSPDFEQQRAIFQQIATAFAKLRQNYPQLDTLSIGMSDDFEAAIAEGATIIRIGSAIFGPRTG